MHDSFQSLTNQTTKAKTSPNLNVPSKIKEMNFTCISLFILDLSFMEINGTSSLMWLQSVKRKTFSSNKLLKCLIYKIGIPAFKNAVTNFTQ